MVTRLHLETWFLPHLVGTTLQRHKEPLYQIQVQPRVCGVLVPTEQALKRARVPTDAAGVPQLPAHQHVPEQAQAGTQPRESPRAHLSTHETQPSRSLVPLACAEPRTAGGRERTKRRTRAASKEKPMELPELGGGGTCTSPRQHGGGSPGRAQKEGRVPSSRQKPLASSSHPPPSRSPTSARPPHQEDGPASPPHFHPGPGSSRKPNSAGPSHSQASAGTSPANEDNTASGPAPHTDPL